MKQGRGAHLTKPGWSKPHTHSNPTNLALFRHKITLYRFSQGAHTIAGGLKWEQGAEPPPATLTTAWVLNCSVVQRDSLGNPLSATQGQWRRRAGDSDETPPIDLLLLYCVRRPTVFSRFLVCQSHKLKERNKVNTHTTFISIISLVCTNQMAHICQVQLKRRTVKQRPNCSFCSQSIT